MKTIVLAAFLFISIQSRALQIHSFTVSAFSGNAINVGLNTEAVELYHFNTWQYVISGNDIVVEASFISGFGSTIAYLNNNFQIPLNTFAPATYQITVKVYYGNSGMLYNPQKLQDTISGTFKTPLRQKVTFKKKSDNILSGNAIIFPNPTTGEVEISEDALILNVYDSSGKMVEIDYRTKRKMSLDNLQDGLYYIEYYFLDKRTVAPVILQKR